MTRFTSTTLTFLLMSASATSCSAFAPAAIPFSTRRSQTGRSRTVLQPVLATPPAVIPNTQKTALCMNDKKNNAFDDLDGKAKDFLFVDVERAKDELAKNWGWIAGSGFLTMVLGFSALYLPLFATGVAYDGTVLTLGATGLVGFFAAFARENGHKLKSALSGIGYMTLAYYMSTHPGAGLNVITLMIATVLAAEGMYETALAAKNSNLQGRPWHFVSGIGSVVASVFLAANVPAASLVAPGIALGGRLTTSGATKMAVGLAGKEIADQRKN